MRELQDDEPGRVAGAGLTLMTGAIRGARVLGISVGDAGLALGAATGADNALDKKSGGTCGRNQAALAGTLPIRDRGGFAARGADQR